MRLPKSEWIRALPRTLQRWPAAAEERDMRIAVVLLVPLLSGCFVMDEIDAGMEASPKKPKQVQEEAPPPAAARKPAKQEPGLFEKATTWVEKKLEGPPPPPDPNDAMVRCILGDREQFLRKYDCESRRGRAIPLPPRGDDG